jgi:hypothetical protein
LLIAVPTAVLWGSGVMAPLLTAMGQLPEVAEAAGQLLKLAWPVLPLLSFSETTGQCECQLVLVCWFQVGD